MKQPVSQFTIGHGHPALEGHFPDNPVVPGVVLLDRAMALLASVHDDLVIPIEFSRVKFLRPVLPGQTVRVSSEQVGTRVAFVCEVDGDVVIDGQLECAARNVAGSNEVTHE